MYLFLLQRLPHQKELFSQVGIIVPRSAEHPRDQGFHFLSTGVLKMESGVFCSNMDKGLRSWATSSPYRSQQVCMCRPRNTERLWIEFSSRHEGPSTASPEAQQRKSHLSVTAAATVMSALTSRWHGLCAVSRMTRDPPVMLSRLQALPPYFRGLAEITI